MAFINEAMVLFLFSFLVGLFLLRSAFSLILEITALESDAVVQEERIVLSANVADAIAGVERAALRNRN
jgi:hypothetical protein